MLKTVKFIFQKIIPHHFYKKVFEGLMLCLCNVSATLKLTIHYNAFISIIFCCDVVPLQIRLCELGTSASGSKQGFVTMAR